MAPCPFENLGRTLISISDETRLVEYLWWWWLWIVDYWCGVIYIFRSFFTWQQFRKKLPWKKITRRAHLSTVMGMCRCSDTYYNVTLQNQTVSLLAWVSDRWSDEHVGTVLIICRSREVSLNPWTINRHQGFNLPTIDSELTPPLRDYQTSDHSCMSSG